MSARREERELLAAGSYQLEGGNSVSHQLLRFDKYFHFESMKHLVRASSVQKGTVPLLIESLFRFRDDGLHGGFLVGQKLVKDASRTDGCCIAGEQDWF